jgi:hypothetical protein
MKIRDLIEQLQRFDPDGYVCVEAICDSEKTPTEIVEVAPENSFKYSAKILIE